MRFAAQAAAERSDAPFTACALSAVAAALGQHAMAEVILEMASPEIAQEVLDWINER